MTEKVKAAFEVIDRVCGAYRGDRKEHVTIQASLQIIHTALNPETDKKKINVPKKALPRNRRKK